MRAGLRGLRAVRAPRPGLRCPECLWESPVSWDDRGPVGVLGQGLGTVRWPLGALGTLRQAVWHVLVLMGALGQGLDSGGGAVGSFGAGLNEFGGWWKF